MKLIQNKYLDRDGNAMRTIFAKSRATLQNFQRNLEFVTLIHKMTKYNNLIQNLLDSHLNELKSTTKNVSGMTLILSSNFRNET